MATTKTQVAALKKKLEEAEKTKALAKETRDEAVKAKEVAEQHGYDVGVAKTEDNLRAKVPAVCRTYCALVWDKALNQAGARPYALKALRAPRLTPLRLFLQLVLL